jgi:hypothetical protein
MVEVLPPFASAPWKGLACSERRMHCPTLRQGDHFSALENSAQHSANGDLSRKSRTGGGVFGRTGRRISKRR